MKLYARPVDGYVALWPHVDLGADYAKALYAVGCRKDRRPTVAKGFAVLVADFKGAQGRPQRLKSSDLVWARAEAVERAEGRPATLFRAVARGKVTVWRKIEMIGSVYTRGGRLVRSDGTLATKAFSPRVKTSLAEFTERLSTTVTHDLSKAIKPLLKERLENWGTLESVDWADLSPAQFDEAFVEARTLLRDAVDKGLGLAAPGMQTKIKLNLVDLHNKNRSLLKQTYLPRIQISFNQVDEQVLDQISSQAGFWIRDSSGQISDSLTRQGRSIVQEGVRQGVGRAVIAQRLISKLPGMYDKFGKTYARVVAANVVSRARSYSEASSYASAGIQSLEVMAMLDERTTNFCRGMDGTIIPVQQSLQHSISAANVASPEDIKTVAPFMHERTNKKTGDREIWIRGGPKYATIQRSGVGNLDDRGMMSKHMGVSKLGKNGVTMPPYHHLCRTMTVPRTDMIQVPANYDAHTSSVPSTDDHRPPRKTSSSKPRQRQQQRPVVPRRIPTLRRPQVDGQSKKIDNVSRSTRDEPADGPVTIREAVSSRDLAEYRRVTRRNIKRSMNAESVRITSVKFRPTHHGGALVYEFRTGDGVRGTWSVEVPKHQMAQLERELKRKLKKGSSPAGRNSPGSLHYDKAGSGGGFTCRQEKSEKVASWNKPGVWERSMDAIVEQLQNDMGFIDAAALVFTGFDKDSEQERQVLTELFAISHVDAWSISSADTSNNLHYLQLAAVEEFGLPRSLIGALDSTVVAHLRGLKRFKKIVAGYRRYARAQYDVTQDFLKKKRVDTLSLSKGAAVRRQTDGPSNATWNGETLNGTIGTQPLTSYTADDNAAVVSVQGRSNAVLVRQKVQADRIYGLYPSGIGSPEELEVIVLGHDKFRCEHTTWSFSSVVEVQL